MKQSMHDLAVLGGSKTFDTTEKTVGRPNVADCDVFIAHVREILDSRVLTNNGPKVREFEQRIATLLNVKHFVAVNNATIGLQVAAKALNVSGEVIVPSFTFVATAQAFDWIGIDVVFCDIDLDTLSFDMAHLKSLVTPRTSAIVPVHVFGRVGNIEAVCEFARAKRLAVICDAAHAFGSTKRSCAVGNFGDCEVFSFHATKVLNCFEGGGIATNDDKLASSVRSMINFGFVTYDQTGSTSGTNAKLSEICAAHGLAALQRFEELIQHNRDITEIYNVELSKIDGIALLKGGHADAECNCHYVAISWNPFKLSLSRDAVLSILLAEGCRARRYFYPGVHQLEPFLARNPAGRCSVPSTERLCTQVMCLPNGFDVSIDDAKKICNILSVVAKDARAIKTALV